MAGNIVIYEVHLERALADLLEQIFHEPGIMPFDIDEDALKELHDLGLIALDWRWSKGRKQYSASPWGIARRFRRDYWGGKGIHAHEWRYTMNPSGIDGIRRCAICDEWENVRGRQPADTTPEGSDASNTD